MAIYKSNPKKIQRSAENLFDTFSDFTNLQNSPTSSANRSATFSSATTQSKS